MPVIYDNDGKLYSTLAYNKESEFQNTVVELADQIFGPETIYIDIKRRVSGNDLVTIPDGYLIDMTVADNSKLFIIENEIQIQFRETKDSELKKQLDVLSKAFGRYIPVPAIRAAINRVRRDKLTGEVFLQELTQIYHLYRMEDYQRRERWKVENGKDDLGRIICSEGLITNQPQIIGIDLEANVIKQ